MKQLLSEEIQKFNKLSKFSFVNEGANASSLRSHVESLGYSSKSTMDESGDLNSDLVEVLKKFKDLSKSDIDQKVKELVDFVNQKKDLKYLRSFRLTK